MLGGVMALGKAFMWMRNRKCVAYFEMAKEVFMRLLGEDSVNAVNAAHKIAWQIPSHYGTIVEFRRLWEKAKVCLPDKAVTYAIAHDLGMVLMGKEQFEEAREFYLAALEGKKRVLGEEHLDTFMMLGNLGTLHGAMMRDFKWGTRLLSTSA